MKLNTLVDLSKAYQATQPSKQRQADVRATLKLLGEAVDAGNSWEQIALASLRYPSRQLARYLQTRVDQQTLKASSARQHRARLKGILGWFEQTDPQGAEGLALLDPAEEALIGRVIRLPGATNAGSSLRALLKSLANEDWELADLALEGPRLMEALVEKIHHQKSWKGRYTSLCRALTYLQADATIPDFDFPNQPHQAGRIAIPSWRTWPEGLLKTAVDPYVQKACDASLTALQWPHPPIQENTLNTRLFALEHYLYRLVEREGAAVFAWSPEDVFDRAHLIDYIAWCREEREGVATTGLASRLNGLSCIAHLLWDLPKEDFRGLLDTRHIKSWKDKTARMTSLDEHLDLIRYIEQQAKRARTQPNRLSLEQLAVLLFFNLCIPVRANNLLHIGLEEHLIKETSSGRWEVRFSAEEVKGQRPLIYEVTPSLQKRLEHYLATTRKQILDGRDSDVLFPTRHGNPLEGTQVNRMLKDQDQACRSVAREDTKNLHLVRDLVTATCARKVRQGVREASKLLGHKNTAVTQGHYFGHYGRQLLLEEHRDLRRIVEAPEMTIEQAHTILRVLQGDRAEYQRFRKALDALPMSKRGGG